MVTDSAIEYAYAEGDLLDQRHDYFYSAFSGPKFLHAWRACRAHAAVAAGRVSGEGVLTEASGTSPTGQALDVLFQSFQQHYPDTTAWATLNRLVHRFEVSKRIHAAYDGSYKPTDPHAYRDLGLYVRFAEVLVRAARASHRLSYLNALLKCMDILTAYATQLTPGLKARYVLLVGVEAELVSGLERAVQGRAAC